MKVEVGKRYQLDTQREYFSVDLQRNVRFCGYLAVEVVSTFCDKMFFGKVIDTSYNNEVLTNNEIEFKGDDVVGEYYPNGLPPYWFFMDFKGFDLDNK